MLLYLTVLRLRSIAPRGSSLSAASLAWLALGCAAPPHLLDQFHLPSPCCPLFPVCYRRSDTWAFSHRNTQIRRVIQMLCVASHLRAFAPLFPLPGITLAWITPLHL